MSHSITRHYAIDIIHSPYGDHELSEFARFTGISEQELIDTADCVTTISLEAELIAAYGPNYDEPSDEELAAYYAAADAAAAIDDSHIDPDFG